MTTGTRLAVVTGASTGIGFATATELHRRGFHVIAGVRSEADADRLAAAGLETITLDVTNDSHIAALAARVTDDPRGRRLGALVNNAGIAINAPIEIIPLNQWRSQFDVNFFGQVAITRALLPALVTAGDARIVNVGSVAGLVATPGYGAYSSSKFALEGFSDVLRREIARLGVRVALIEPGTIATPIWNKGIDGMAQLRETMTDGQRERNDDLIDAIDRRARAQTGGGIPASVVAAVIAGAIQSTKPRTRYLVGRDAKLLARMKRLLSDAAFDRLVARNLGLTDRSAATSE